MKRWQEEANSSSNEVQRAAAIVEHVEEDELEAAVIAIKCMYTGEDAESGAAGPRTLLSGSELNQ